MDETVPVEAKAVIPLHPPLTVEALIAKLKRCPADAQVCQGDEYDSIVIRWSETR